MQEPRRLGRGDRHGGGGHPGAGHDEIGLGAAAAGGATAKHQGIGGVAAHREGEAGVGGGIENDVRRLEGGALHGGAARALNSGVAGGGEG